MEDTLGTTLIKRTTRSITLTDAGHYLFNRANKLLKEFDETLNTTSGYYHNPQGNYALPALLPLVIPGWSIWWINTAPSFPT